jgi:hypothetical protein
VGTCFLGVGGEGFVFGAAPHPLAGARGIALRSPCCAQALGDHPWSPARRVRRAPFGRSPALRAAVGVEMLIALDGKAKWSACFANLAHADESEFGRSDTEICEAEGDVVEPELLGSIPGPRPAGQPKVCSKRLLPF